MRGGSGSAAAAAHRRRQAALAASQAESGSVWLTLHRDDGPPLSGPSAPSSWAGLLKGCRPRAGMPLQEEHIVIVGGGSGWCVASRSSPAALSAPVDFAFFASSPASD